jgi:non-ribosomal peptide synthetase component F
MELDGAEADGLRSISRREGATLFMVLLACFNALMHCAVDESDVVVGTDLAGRNHPEVEGLIGFFINHLVLRTELSGNPTFRELLARVRDVCLEAYAHQDVPFDRLVEELSPERDPGCHPLFQTLFVMQNLPEPELDFRGLSIAPVGSDTCTSKFDLALFLHEDERSPDRRLQGYWVYSTELFDGATIRRLADQYAAVVSFVISQPEIRLAELKKAIEAAEAARRQRERERREAANYSRFQRIRPQGGGR